MANPTHRAGLRADLHCHSNASNEADEAVLNAINCPESYSEPAEVYDQAKRRGMDFVTITDHDSIQGVLPLSSRADVLVGEEVTCYFPEDHCKIHLLVWGLNSADHDAMQKVANDIYQVAEYVEHNNLAHSVAHPVYRQNDVLERWHLERLALMFKGFECLNGAHSALHREALEPFVDSLTPERIETLSRRHGMTPRWPQPWIKARTGGSDDHGLFNVGRTWTEFPADAITIPALLQCIREARCTPGGEAGSSLKLAHNFFGVGIRYYARQLAPKSPAATLLGLLTGEKQPRLKIAIAAARGWSSGLGRKVAKIITRQKQAGSGTALLFDVLGASIRKQLKQAPALRNAVMSGKAPLAEHAAMFNLVSAVNHDVADGIRQAVAIAMKDGEIGPVFDAISAIAAHQFMMLPYYFALFHQNRERHVLSRVTGHKRSPGRAMRLGVFTDALDETSGVSRFIKSLETAAWQQDAKMIVHACGASRSLSPVRGGEGRGEGSNVEGRSIQRNSKLRPSPQFDNLTAEQPVPLITGESEKDAPQSSVTRRKDFAPLLSLPMPFYGGLSLNIPPVLEALEWADRQQFDAIHVHTPGPMGLCGLLVAKMLRIPLIATCHTDFPASLHGLTGDYRLTGAMTGYITWFYNQATTVLARSRSSLRRLEKLGIDPGKLALMPPAVDSEKFSPGHRNIDCWEKIGVQEQHKILYAGRVSVEKNLPMLAEAFKRLCAARQDAALIVAGDGPYLALMRKSLEGCPVYFLGSQDDSTLPVLYASSDIFAFPSRIDTLGQEVMEAQASGLPVLVSNEGGPCEMMDEGLSGLALSGVDARAWSEAMNRLIEDTPLRLRMARIAPHRMARYAPKNAFETFWELHAKAAASVTEKEGCEAVAEPTKDPKAHVMV